VELQVDGKPVFVASGGRPIAAGLPAVVMIHGAGMDHIVWTLPARSLSHRGRAVLAPDLPGHGRSDGPALTGIAEMAAWIIRLLDAAGIEQAALVGHSMGSLIALEAAGRAPQRITRLVMVGTAYPMKVSDALLATARDTPLRAIDMVNAFSLSSLASKPSYPGPGMWLHGANRALMRRMQAGQPGLNLFHHDFGVCDRYANGMAAAAQVQCPVSLVLGAQDQMTPPTVTREIAAALKARIDTLPCGHAMMQEQPDAMLAALRSALQ
jgi:pimeloyl-ACP methyl ester carboxylesterase